MNRYELTKRIAIIGIIANIALLFLKLSIGFLSKSQAMIADGFNSAGDVFASVATYAGNKIASQPEDPNHPYGHGKAEYIFSMIISFSLMLVGYQIFRSSLNAIIHQEQFIFSWWLAGIAIFTIVLKLVLFIYTKNAGAKEDNLLILANAEDHRNDVFVTSSTLLGIVLGSMGIFWLDGVVGIGISFWIVFVGIRIFMSAYNVLMDTNINEKVKIDIIKAIQAVPGVDHVDDVTAKPIGLKFIIFVKVSVPGDMSVEEGHGIAAEIKERVKNFKDAQDVLVHVNPC